MQSRIALVIMLSFSFLVCWTGTRGPSGREDCRLRNIFGALFLFLFLLPATLFAQSSVDNPLSDSVQTGADPPLFGWKCIKNGELSARFDGGPPFTVLYGSDRGDTAGTCGDDGKNGFVLPFNWNILGDGQHTLELFDEGVKFAEVSFSVVTFGSEFLVGPTTASLVVDFPDSESGVVVSWDPASQNFRITQVIEPGTTSSSPFCPFVLYENDRVVVVTKAIDGRTVELQGGERVRYIGIATPEEGQPGFAAAIRRNAELVEGKSVILDVCEADPLDPFGHTQAYLIVDPVDSMVVNEVLLDEGLATPLPVPPCSNATDACYVLIAADLPVPDECDPAYPTICVASAPPDLSCNDIPYRNFPVLPSDPHMFDDDNDSLGCEVL